MFFAAAAPAVGAARKPISGTLSKPGFTVIALAANGKARSVRAPRGSFRLTPPGDAVTLHLRSANGVYAGPIVIRGEGKRAVLGVKAGARLGKITVGAGYARLARRLAKRWVDATRIARAQHSVPIGARRFGRVRSRPPRAAPPGDRDRDGIPNVLDIDDDGDLVIDNLDSSAAGRRARAAQGGCGPANIYCPVVSSGITGELHERERQRRIDARADRCGLQSARRAQVRQRHRSRQGARLRPPHQGPRLLPKERQHRLGIGR